MKRNISRFPDDFMFQLKKDEVPVSFLDLYNENSKSQNATSSWGGNRKLPYTFTEQVYHCGASSKDAGKKLCAINKVENTGMLHPMVDKLLEEDNLII